MLASYIADWMQIELSRTAQIDTVVIITSFFRLRPVPKYRFEHLFQKNTRLQREPGKTDTVSVIRWWRIPVPPGGSER